LCRPAELPIESDLQRLKEYCVKKMTNWAMTTSCWMWLITDDCELWLWHD